MDDFVGFSKSIVRKELLKKEKFKKEKMKVIFGDRIRQASKGSCSNMFSKTNC